MKIMNLKNKVFIFWGCMDVLAIVMYCFFSFYKGNIPLYSDVRNFYNVFISLEVSGWTGFFILIMFTLHLIMQLSLFYSAYALLKKNNLSVWFLCCQEILRAFSLTCSLAFIPFILHFIHGYPSHLGASLFIFSEICKVGTFWWCKRR